MLRFLFIRNVVGEKENIEEFYKTWHAIDL